MRAGPSALALWLVAAGFFLTSLPAHAGQKQPAPKGLRLEERLTEDDARDRVRTTSYSKLHVYKMEAGRQYRIDMISREVDAFLRLEDPTGKEVAFDDDGGGNLNARIVYTAQKSGIHRIIATTYQPNQTGSYLLLVSEAVPVNPLVAKALSIASRTPTERKQILDELRQDFRKRKSKLGASDVNLVLQMGKPLEAKDSAAAAEIYTALGSVLRRASNKQVAQTGKMIEGMGRRLRLPGNTIDIRGTTLDGKELDWGAYRGKVVLVDFWATWCGPCLKELPNLRHMYQTYNPRGFDVVGISLDHTRAPLMHFLNQQKLPWVCLYDEGPEKGIHPLATYYGIRLIPTAILVDREGRVVSLNARGPELRRLLEKYLGPAEKP